MNTPLFRHRELLPCLAGSLLLSAGAAASQPEPSLMDLSLEDLLNMEVVSASRKSQSLSDVAAAVYIITAEDIRRAGVTSIPEALRLAPGIHAARIDSNKWAISARGFTTRFNTKLLVLIDGRSIYTSLFNSVFWNVQDTLLEDIERIEVIRGPGAAMWGANAVNGVINIITKSARDTQGTLVSLGAGDEERGFGSVRYGGSLNDKADYRVYFKHFERDGAVSESGTKTADDWHISRAGFRVDWDLGLQDQVTLEGDAYSGQAGETITTVSLSPPSYAETSEADKRLDGGNLQLHWERGYQKGGDLTLQLHYGFATRRSRILDFRRDTFDLDFQYRFTPWKRHDLMWGLGYRFTRHNNEDTLTAAFDDNTETQHLFSGFLQDEITLLPNRLYLTLGSKIEHNSYTGFEFQPNIRLAWTPDEQQSVWGSISKAVRTPARIDRNAQVSMFAFPPGFPGVPGVPPNPSATLPMIQGPRGNDYFGSEDLIAFELGYRVQATETLSLDIATFFNDYDNLTSRLSGEFLCQPSGTPTTTGVCPGGDTHLYQPLYTSNTEWGETYGLELAADWRQGEHWRLQLAYSFNIIQLHSAVDRPFKEFHEKGSPHNIASLRSSHDLPHDTELDLWVRYVDNIPTIDLHSYVTFDVRLGWRPRKNLELSLVGQNLFGSPQREYDSELRDIAPTEIEPSTYLQVRWTRH